MTRALEPQPCLVDADEREEIRRVRRAMAAQDPAFALWIDDVVHLYDACEASQADPGQARDLVTEIAPLIERGRDLLAPRRTGRGQVLARAADRPEGGASSWAAEQRNSNASCGLMLRLFTYGVATAFLLALIYMAVRAGGAQ